MKIYTIIASLLFSSIASAGLSGFSSDVTPNVSRVISGAQFEDSVGTQGAFMAPDACPNISGYQATLPGGYALVDGSCVAPCVAPASTTSLVNELCPSGSGSIQKLVETSYSCLTPHGTATPSSTVIQQNGSCLMNAMALEMPIDSYKSGTGFTVGSIHNIIEVVIRNETGFSLNSVSIKSCLTFDRDNYASQSMRFRSEGTGGGGFIFSNGRYIPVSTKVLRWYISGRQIIPFNYGCTETPVSISIPQNAVFGASVLASSNGGFWGTPGDLKNLSYYSEQVISQLPVTYITPRGQYFIVKFTNGKQVRFENNQTFYENQ